MGNPNSDFSTRGGELGFRAILESNSVCDEFQYLWDDIPKELRLKQLDIVHFKTGHSFLSLKNYEWYFFENEAASSVNAGIFIHTAKILGGVNPGRGAVEIRLEFNPKSILPSVSKIEYSWDEWENKIKRTTKKSLRSGVAGVKKIII